MRRFVLFFSIILLTGQFLKSQELNCSVQVITPKLQTADPAIFRTFENAVYEFMNNRNWTDDQYTNTERIECKLIITISEELSSDRFRANATLQSIRPVYNSDYKTVLFNYVDKEFEFTYSEYLPLEFNENAHLSNLTSLLAYYAYVMVGIDYDSYGKNGGTPFYLKAQSIINNAQNVTERGWKSYESVRNRYWLIENLINAKYSTYRSCLYEYHRLGLDKMYDDRNGSTKTITNSLEKMNTLNNDNPNLMAIQLFFNAKSDELVSIYSGAPPTEKTKAINILTRLDAANSEKYLNILK